MAEIFISYRRRDTWGHAQLLQEQLVRWFGEESAFFDRDGESIPAAEKFPLAIEKAVEAAEVVLAVIGPDWLSEENKLRLLEDENDFVRRELALSLSRLVKGENLLVYLASPRFDDLAASGGMRCKAQIAPCGLTTQAICNAAARPPDDG